MTSHVARKLKQTRTVSSKTRKVAATSPTLIINNDENERHVFVNMGNGKMVSLSNYLKGISTSKKGGRRMMKTRRLRKQKH